jgi:hypothetical protein
MLHPRQQSFQRLVVGAVTNIGFSQRPFALTRFFGQDMAAIGFGIDEFTGFGSLKPFGSGTIGFYFRHYGTPYNLL